MKDHTANIIAKRMTEIAANKAAIRNDQTQIDTLTKDIEEKERSISNLCRQVKGCKTAELSAEQLAGVVDALFDEREYQSVRSELSMLTSVSPGTDKTYLFIYRLKNLIWLSSNFDLDAAAVSSYLAALLQDDPEIPDFGPVDWEVDKALYALETVFAEKGKPLPSYTIDAFPVKSISETRFDVSISIC